MNRDWFLLIGLLLLLTSAFLSGDASSAKPTTSYVRVEGRLYTGRLKELDRDVPMPQAPVPTVPLFLADVKSIGLTSDTTSFLVRLVAKQEAKGTIETKKSAKRFLTLPHAIPAQTSVAVSEPRPASPDSFKDLNDALESLDSTFPLDEHLRKGGVTLQLTQLGKLNDDYLLKYSVSNEEEKEFFVASVEATANNATLPSQFPDMPFCPPGSEITGILKFSRKSAAHQSVGVRLVEAADKFRNMEIKNVGYKF